MEKLRGLEMVILRRGQLGAVFVQSLLFLAAVAMVIVLVVSPPGPVQSLVVTLFTFAALGLPWIYFYHTSIRVACAMAGALYAIGMVVPDLVVLRGIGIAVAAASALVSTFTGPRIADGTSGVFGTGREEEDGTGREGAGACPPAYYITLSLCFLNPVQFIQMAKQVVGQAAALVRSGGRLPMPESYPVVDSSGHPYIQRTRYTLPFKGEWLIAQGGVAPDESHSYGVIAQRYAYDFVMIDDDGNSSEAEGRECSDYFCYRREILAPADGEVVSTFEGVRDSPWPGRRRLDFLSRHFCGNHIVLRHSENEYSFMAHLARGSIRVRPGDRVQRGQVIAECGNSGHSTEPHLHFHVQDMPSIYSGIGIPVKFADLEVDRSPVQSTYLTAGSRVRSLPHLEKTER